MLGCDLQIRFTFTRTSQGAAPASPSTGTSQGAAPASPSTGTSQGAAPASPSTGTSQGAAPASPSTGTSQGAAPASPSTGTSQGAAPASPSTGTSQGAAPASPSTGTSQGAAPASPSTGTSQGAAPPLHQQEQVKEPPSPLHQQEQVKEPPSPLHQQGQVKEPPSPLHQQEQVKEPPSPLHQQEQVKEPPSPLHQQGQVKEPPSPLHQQEQVKEPPPPLHQQEQVKEPPSPLHQQGQVKEPPSPLHQQGQVKEPPSPLHQQGQVKEPPPPLHQQGQVKEPATDQQEKVAEEVKEPAPPLHQQGQVKEPPPPLHQQGQVKEPPPPLHQQEQVKEPPSPLHQQGQVKEPPSPLHQHKLHQQGQVKEPPPPPHQQEQVKEPPSPLHQQGQVKEPPSPLHQQGQVKEPPSPLHQQSRSRPRLSINRDKSRSRPRLSINNSQSPRLSINRNNKEPPSPLHQQGQVKEPPSPLHQQGQVKSRAAPASPSTGTSQGAGHRPAREGRRGWYCFDSESCEQRWQRLRPLMTSRGWPETRHVGGILSPHPEENPHWWNANHVFVPYCSSDSWSGTRRAAEGSGELSFMGSVIVEEVVAALLNLNFTHGHKLILAGSSAGGVGVLVNVDRVASQIAHLGIQAEVRAVADSGWFLDNEPFAPLKCVDAHSCPPVEAIRRGQELWQGRIPDQCREKYPHHPWFCYFGYRIYPTMKSPLFVFQWVFDEAQMTADNVGKPNSKEQWDYIHGIGKRLMRTLENVTALFAPSCISHTVLTKRNWAGVKIGQMSLPQALYCWDITPSEALVAKTPQNRGKNDHRLHDGGRQLTTMKHHCQRHHKSRKCDRGNQRKGNSARTKNNTQSESERRNGRRKGKKSKTMSQELGKVADSSSISGNVHSSHLVLKRTQQRVNNSDNNSDNGSSVTSVDFEQSQGTNRQRILKGEMLADSPKNSVQVSSSSGSPYVVESNSIDTPQENVQIIHTEEGQQSPNRSGSQTSKIRPKKHKRKNRNKKERERKKRKRERRRKRRERQRQRLKRRKRRQKEKGQRRRRKSQRRKTNVGRSLEGRGQGLSDTEENSDEGLRSARSLFLLHSKQIHIEPVTTTDSSLHHSSQATTGSSPTPSVTAQSSQKAGNANMQLSEDEYTEDMCPPRTLHLTDRCEWPHCNYACPKLLNPFTGEEMNFIELLKSFGLDMSSVANALGIDIHTLNSMGNNELLLILTQ
nr:uncharacterized protein LOC123751432 [Procambarus clarkii]